MSRLNWHPRYHRAFLEGTQRLSLEERGCYTTILDLIYDRGGPIPDDARWLAGWMNCSVRKWTAIRSALIAAGKIIIEGEGNEAVIRNERADFELDSQSARRRANVESGSSGGRKSAEKRAKAKENNDKAQATAQPSLKLKTETETVSSVDKSTDAVRVVVDHDKDAWDQAVSILTDRGALQERQARSLFGRLLSSNGLEARDMLPSLASALVNQTQDPAAYLTKAAESIAKRRHGPPRERRVAWV